MWVTLPEGGSPFFKENGNYQATHAINMGFKKLLNLSTPSEPYEAATKEYVDNVKKKHDSSAHYCDEVNYHGLLRSDKYQFAFGGNSIDPYGNTGFLVPQSGRTKKIQVKFVYGTKNLWRILKVDGSIFTIIVIDDRGGKTNLLSYQFYTR